MLVIDWIRNFFGLGISTPEEVVESKPTVQQPEVKVDLSTMTRNQLIAVAKEKGLTVKPNVKKSELLEVLK